MSGLVSAARAHEAAQDWWQVTSQVIRQPLAVYRLGAGKGCVLGTNVLCTYALCTNILFS